MTVEIIQGDAGVVLAGMVDNSFDSIITDPVWPGTKFAEQQEISDPAALFAEVAVHFPRLASTVVVHLGCDSDPRFLLGMPKELPFLRVCWLEYVRPHYKGRLLYGSDVAYVFGQPPRVRPNGFLMPGKVLHNDAKKRPEGHPCPRQLQHVRWLVEWFGGKSVLDPFFGSGTTGVACKEKGIKCVGVEIMPEYVELARRRCALPVTAPLFE